MSYNGLTRKEGTAAFEQWWIMSDADTKVGERATIADALKIARSILAPSMLFGRRFGSCIKLLGERRDCQCRLSSQTPPISPSPPAFREDTCIGRRSLPFPTWRKRDSQVAPRCQDELSTGQDWCGMSGADREASTVQCSQTYRPPSCTLTNR